MYIQRGSSLRLFAARVRALLRRYPSHNSLVEGLSADPAPLYVTATERRLLVCLSNHDGRPVALEELRLQVWADSVGTDTVKHYLARLRRKLTDKPCGLDIVAVRGIGYRLVARESLSPTREGRKAAMVASETRDDRAGVA